MIEVKRAILHILDLNSGVPVYSDNDLDREIFEYLQKHLEKASRDAAAHTSKLGEVNPVRQALERYRQNPDLFAEVTREMAAKPHQDLMLCGEEQALDFVAVDMMHMEIPHLAILMYPNQLGYTHKVTFADNQQNNQIIQHHAILPNPTQKVSSFVFIDMEN